MQIRHRWYSNLAANRTANLAGKCPSGSGRVLVQRHERCGVGVRVGLHGPAALAASDLLQPRVHHLGHLPRRLRLGRVRRLPRVLAAAKPAAVAAVAAVSLAAAAASAAARAGAAAGPALTVAARHSHETVRQEVP